MLHQLPANSSTVNQRKSALIMTSQMGLSTITANGSIHYKEPAKAQSPSFRGPAQLEVLSSWARILSKSFTIKLPGKPMLLWNGLPCYETKWRFWSLTSSSDIADKMVIHSEWAFFLFQKQYLLVHEVSENNNVSFLPAVSLSFAALWMFF